MLTTFVAVAVIVIVVVVFVLYIDCKLKKTEKIEILVKSESSLGCFAV